MTRLTLALALVSMLGGCAYSNQQAMIEVPNATSTPAPTVDPICDNAVARADAAEAIGDESEDLICALTEKLDPR
jgi:hypothetical protein